ncbi:MAG: hypothetical protein JW847_06870 [Candidatus Omnitrophica bacterium]|nr:hypothetical protein [Candidatus Omnitrophota bacterium]
MLIFQRPKHLDALLLSVFTALITVQPHFLFGKINLFELGIYLPGINAVLDGLVPFRDFFHLRGPGEFYIPALLMRLFGENVTVLSTYFYVGTVITLIIGVFIAAAVFKTRFVLYLMVPVLVARTFPRISFYYWGGMRYALGMLALVLAVKSFKSRKPSSMVWAGIVSCLAFWTTIEAGISTMVAIGGSTILLALGGREIRVETVKVFLTYMMGVLLLFVPSVLWMGFAGALIPYWEMTYTVLTKTYITFVNGPGLHPVGVTGFLKALVPGAEFSKSMTPVYFYMLLFLYFIWRIKNKTFDGEMTALVCIALYGVVLYIGAFRRLDGHHFEMALQPEKNSSFLFAGKSLSVSFKDTR